MWRMIVGVLITLIPFFGLAQDSPSKPDGRMWQMFGVDSQSVITKTAYVEGAIEGLRRGRFTGYLQGRGEEANANANYIKPCIEKGPCATIPITMLLKPVNANTLNELTPSAEKAREIVLLPHNTSILDVVHQMDMFYADDRNTPICMITAVQESILSLRGPGTSELGLKMERQVGCNK